VLESGAGNDSPKTFKTIPDGLPGLIYQQSDNGIFYQEDEQLPSMFLYGQSTKPANIRIAGSFKTMGIYFYPYALQSVFGLSAKELTDISVDMVALAGSRAMSMLEQLGAGSSIETRLDILTSFISHQVDKYNKRENELLPYVVSKIIQSKGTLSIKDLRLEIGLTERTFERKFLQGIGIPPRLFARICRFQAALNQLRTADFNKLSDLAYEHDYADQSHFIRVFREFTGFSPLEYRQHSRGQVQNFPHVVS
jgi:AraC-like DNA-binding protein